MFPAFVGHWGKLSIHLFLFSLHLVFVFGVHDIRVVNRFLPVGQYTFISCTYFLLLFLWKFISMPAKMCLMCIALFRIKNWFCFRACLVIFFKSLGKIQGTKITMHSGGRGEFFFLLYSLIPISWKTWAYSIFLILIAYSKTTRFFIYGKGLSIKDVYWEEGGWGTVLSCCFSRRLRELTSGLLL